ncbi:MAG: tetratricopeptide repeat protein, partial [Muribaculaceae bacterium]|nr:tetratricopeptide repeat protein [Muribaculaceae bacterium]
SIYILEGDMLFAQKAYGDAATKYNQAINFDKDNPEGYVKYANTYFYVSPQFAIEKLNELLALQPNSALAQRELAEKYYNANQWTKAAEQYGKYINNPNHFPEDKARYAVLLYASNEYQKSLNVANDILKSNPNDFQSQRLQMLNLAALEQYEAAQQAAAKFFSLTEKGNAKFTPNDFTTYGNVLQKLGQTDAAVEQYQKAYNLDPTRLDILKLISAAYNANKDFTKAADVFQQYIDLSGEKASLNDIYLLSNRMLRAAATTENDTARVEYANKGITAIDRVIEGADEDADYYFSKAMMQAMTTPDKTFSADALPTLLKVVELLDANPANADPTNASNQINRYSQVWSYIASIYKTMGKDNDVRTANDKAAAYKALLKQ